MYIQIDLSTLLLFAYSNIIDPHYEHSPRKHLKGKSPLEFTLEKKHMDTAKFIIYFNGIS